MEEVELIAFRLPKKEAQLFDEAIKKSGRFMNRSDALRYLVREFIREMKVEVKV
jgi:Arc/MetJ-type ribon-helix-helix transcriptional regulator